MSSPLRRLTLALLLVATTITLAAGCGNGSEDEPADRTDTTDAREDEDPEPTPLPEPVPPGELPPIQVTSPVAFQTVANSFVLAGTAQVHEGTLAWTILDAKLRPIVRGTITANCGAPCRGRFRARVPIAKVPLGSWELHVWSPNVEDDGPERLHETMVPITVVERIDPNAPTPGGAPPGGAPQS